MTDVQRHLSTSLKSHGIISGMVRGADVVGDNLVVQWSRSINRNDKSAIQDLTICFNDNASAALAADILQRGMPEIVSEKTPTRRGTSSVFQPRGKEDFTAC